MSRNVFTTALVDIIYATDEDANHIFLVMDYIESDLDKVLKSAKKIKFTDDHIITLIYNIISALNFLHSANVIHRDIKPANILVDGNCQIKICDFGLSRSLPKMGKHSKTEVIDSMFKIG